MEELLKEKGFFYIMFSASGRHPRKQHILIQVDDNQAVLLPADVLPADADMPTYAQCPYFDDDSADQVILRVSSNKFV